MANLTTVGLTAGAGSSGTGSVSTLDNLIGTAGAGNTNILTVQGSATGTAIPTSLASVPSHAVTNAGTFAVQNSAATPAGTNVIGHVIVDTAPSTAVTNAGTFAVQADSTLAQNATTSGQKAVLIQGAVTTAAPTYTTTQSSPLSLDTAGNLRVNVVTGGGSGGTSSTVGSAAPTTATAVGFSDGTNMVLGRVKAASTAAVATDPAIVVAQSPNSIQLGAGATTAITQRVVLANDSVLASGLALPANSSPVVIAPQTTDVSVTPTVTAGAYTAGFIMGGLMTFANATPTVGNNGVLQSITVKFKDTAVTGNVNVHVFKDTTLSGTYADHTAGTWNSADAAKLIGSYQLPTPYSKLGTMTIYNLDGIGKAFVAAGTSLFALVTVDGTPTPASTSSMTVQLAVLPG